MDKTEAILILLREHCVERSNTLTDESMGAAALRFHEGRDLSHDQIARLIGRLLSTGARVPPGSQ